MSQPKPGFGNFIAPHETFKLPILRTKTQETCLSLTHLLYIIPEEGKRDLNNIHYGLCFEPLTPLEGLLSTASSIKLLSRDILLRSLFRYIYLGILRYDDRNDFEISLTTLLCLKNCLYIRGLRK